MATDSLDPSGMGEHMLILGQGVAHEFDITIVAPRASVGSGLLDRAAMVGLRIKLLEAGTVEPFREWLGRFGATLVHVHAGIGWEAHGLVRAAKRVGLPVIRTEHLPYLLTNVVQQAEYRAMLLSVDRRIAVSQAVAASHRERGGGRVEVVANGIVPNTAVHSRAATRVLLGIGANDPIVLTVARLAPQKGHDVLLAAIPIVLQALPGARFVLVGGGIDEGAIRFAIAERQLTDNVMLLGSRADVPDLLGAADLFALPSQFEGLPLVVLEAMAASLPVVATAIGGNIEALGANHPLLVSPGDAGALAQAIVGALTDPTSTRAATQTARTRYSEWFTGERMARETAAIYRSVIGTLEPQGASP